MWVPRSLAPRLPRPSERTLVVITGPRQAGKTSLAQRLYKDLRYISLDSPENRDVLAALRTSDWSARVGDAVLDEVQKEPVVLDKLKHAFDGGEIGFSVLLGSAQILLMRQISETLAGRTLIYELWPLSMAELTARSHDRVQRPLLVTLVEDGISVSSCLHRQPEKLLPDEEHESLSAFEHLADWGGMPGLLHLEPGRRKDWLASYTRTYLERDLADLARLSDLRPFRTFQRLAGLRAASLISFADLSRDAKVSATTARNYLEYLRISYQAFLLPPYHENLTSALVKSPKLYWSDLGILRQLTGHQGLLTGLQFENLGVAEVVKTLRAHGADAEPYFYRTRTGMEVDLLLECGNKLLALEFKNREVVERSDARGLRHLANALGERWLGGLVVHRGSELATLDDEQHLWSVPIHRLLGMPSQA